MCLHERLLGDNEEGEISIRIELVSWIYISIAVSKLPGSLCLLEVTQLNNRFLRSIKYFGQGDT